MILLPTSWRIFLFHSANSSVVILGFAETILSMLESRPISISLLNLFQFIDIASRKFRPVLTSFLNLEFAIILRSPVKHGHNSHRQNLYVVDNHILLCLCGMLYRQLCQWKIESLYNLEFYFLLFFQSYIQQKEVHQFSIYREKDFLHYLNEVLNLVLLLLLILYSN